MSLLRSLDVFESFRTHQKSTVTEIVLLKPYGKYCCEERFHCAQDLTPQLMMKTVQAILIKGDKGLTSAVL